MKNPKKKKNLMCLEACARARVKQWNKIKRKLSTHLIPSSFLLFRNFATIRRFSLIFFLFFSISFPFVTIQVFLLFLSFPLYKTHEVCEMSTRTYALLFFFFLSFPLSASDVLKTSCMRYHSRVCYCCCCFFALEKQRRKIKIKEQGGGGTDSTEGGRRGERSYCIWTGFRLEYICIDAHKLTGNRLLHLLEVKSLPLLVFFFVYKSIVKIRGIFTIQLWSVLDIPRW